MFWVSASYQTCMDSVSGDYNLYRGNGSSFKQRYAFEPITSRLHPTVQLLSGAFFHFQEWKKQYNSWGLVFPHHGLDQQPLIMTRGGFIALAPTNDPPFPWIHRYPSALKYCVDQSRGHCVTAHMDDFRVLAPSSARVRAWNELRQPVHGLEQLYDITLAMVALHVSQLDRLRANAQRWSGPKAIVVVCATEDEVDLVSSFAAELSDATVHLYRSDAASAAQNAFLNFALDMVFTRFAVPLFPDHTVSRHAYATLRRAIDAMAPLPDSERPQLVLLHALEPAESCGPAPFDGAIDIDSPFLAPYPRHTLSCANSSAGLPYSSLDEVGTAWSPDANKVLVHQAASGIPGSPFLVDLHAAKWGHIPVRFVEEFGAQCYESVFPWAVQTIGMTVHVLTTPLVVVFRTGHSPLPLPRCRLTLRCCRRASALRP
jgi:hypothetical protein